MNDALCVDKSSCDIQLTDPQDDRPGELYSTAIPSTPLAICSPKFALLNASNQSVWLAYQRIIIKVTYGLFPPENQLDTAQDP